MTCQHKRQKLENVRQSKSKPNFNLPSSSNNHYHRTFSMLRYLYPISSLSLLACADGLLTTSCPAEGQRRQLLCDFDKTHDWLLITDRSRFGILVWVNRKNVFRWYCTALYLVVAYSYNGGGQSTGNNERSSSVRLNVGFVSLIGLSVYKQYKVVQSTSY